MEKCDLFYGLFKGRTDQMGVDEKIISIPVTGDEEILAKVRDHLEGFCRIGLYVPLIDRTTPWAMIEFEDHGKPNDIKNPEERSIEFMQHMTSVGINVHRELSKHPNGKCYHLWIFFDKPILAKTVREALNTFLEKVMEVKTEVFPKSDGGTSLGNFVWLPYFGGMDKWGHGCDQNRTVFIDAVGTPYEDQWSYFENVTRTDELAIEKLVAEYKLDKTIANESVKKKSSSNSAAQISTGDKVLVESSPLVAGLDKVRECTFMLYCEQNASSLSEPLWYVWMTNAVRCCGGRAYVHEYSAQHPGYDRVATDKKIAHAVADTGPMKHETIRELWGECDCGVDLISPISRATHKDIQKELDAIAKMTIQSEQLAATKVLLKYWAKRSTEDRTFWRDIIIKKLPSAKKMMPEYERKISSHYEPDYEKDLETILNEMARTKEKDEKRAEIMYKWLIHRDGHVFRDREKMQYLHIGKKMMSVNSTDGDFRSFFYDYTKISMVRNEAKIIVDVLQSIIQKNGKLIESDTWLKTDKINYRVYFHLNNDRDEIICISPSSVEVMENGSNADSVLLIPSSKIKAIEFSMPTDTEYANALMMLKELVIDNMACPLHDRLMCYAWRLSGMLLDFTQASPHLRLEGDSKSGKSTAMELMSYVVYGTDQKKKGTIASNYSDGARNPLLLLDNIEKKNMGTPFQDFIITAVTGIVNEKRDVKTKHDVLQERTKCLVCTSGIENLQLNEILNRSYIVDFDRVKYGGKYNVSTPVDIEKNRNAILSAEFLLTSRVLKRMRAGEWNTCNGILSKEFPYHSKERLNSFMAIMVLVTDELLHAWGSTEDVWDIVQSWIEGQGKTQTTTATQSNVIVTCLGLLQSDAMRLHAAPSFVKWEYDVQIVNGVLNQIQFYGSASQFHSSFSKASRNRNLSYEYKDAHQLSKRIRDGQSAINDAGWTYEVEPGSGNTNVYTFTFAPEGDEFISLPSPLSSPSHEIDENAEEINEIGADQGDGGMK